MKYSDIFADCEPDLLSPLTLLERGTRNRRWNQIAQEVSRKHHRLGSLTFLQGVEQMLNSPITHREADWFWRNQDPAPKGSWLNHERDTGRCRDCGKTTHRRYNGYFQCQTCADQIRAHGSRDDLNLYRLAQAVKKAEAPKSAVVESIPDIVPAYEQRVSAANAEVYAAGQATYDQVKHNGPLAEAVQTLRSEVVRAA